MLKNAALDAKIGVDTAENEPRKGSENLKTEKNVDQFTVDLAVLLSFSALSTPIFAMKASVFFTEKN